MAFRLMNRLRTVVSQSGYNRSFASSSATSSVQSSKMAMTADMAPIYMIGGFVAIALGLAGHTMKQHLVHSPDVSLSKKRRESLAEMEDPDAALISADKFLNKSFLRKVGHIQKHPHDTTTLPLHDVFTRPRNVESLKSVGVNPKAP